MKSFLLILSLTLFKSMVFAQSKGDLFRKNGELEKAINTYKLDLEKAEGDYTLNYNLACAYAIKYQKDSAFKYLKKALTHNTSLWALADNDLYSLVNDKRWSKIENEQLRKYQQEKGNLKKPDYAKQLLRLIMADQALDYQLDMAKQFYMKNNKIPHWYYPIAAMKKEITKDNFSKMESLIAKNGWPTYTKVGRLAADSPLLVINHHENDSIRIKYISQIKKACLNKEGSCIEYAKIQDRILVNTNKKQLYGMQFEYDKSRNLVPLPIKNPEFVDRRRAAIGLEPLKSYLKRKINYNFTVKQL